MLVPSSDAHSRQIWAGRRQGWGIPPHLPHGLAGYKCFCNVCCLLRFIRRKWIGSTAASMWTVRLMWDTGVTSWDRIQGATTLVPRYTLRFVWEYIYSRIYSYISRKWLTNPILGNTSNSIKISILVSCSNI